MHFMRNSLYNGIKIRAQNLTYKGAKRVETTKERNVKINTAYSTLILL